MAETKTLGMAPQSSGLRQGWALKKTVLIDWTTNMLPRDLPNVGWEQSDHLGFPCRSFSPSQVACSDQATGLELMEERYWQRCLPSAPQLTALRWG